MRNQKKNHNKNTKRLLMTPLLSIALIATLPLTSAHALSQNGFVSSYSDRDNIRAEHVPLMYNAEVNASPQGSAVLRQARIMGLDKRVLGKNIGKGSCWDYLDKTFHDAGFPRAKRRGVFKGKYPAGPFVRDLNTIKRGDWLYFINLSYNNSQHSGLFVDWVNKDNKMALVFSYSGQGRNEAGKYTIYDLSKTYHIMRPVGNGNLNSQATKRPNIASPITTNKIATKSIKKTSHTDAKRTLLTDDNPQQKFIDNYATSNNVQDPKKHLPIIYKASQDRTPASNKVVDLVKRWTLDDLKVIKGTSANYVKTAFSKAGVKQDLMFKSEYPNGPFYKNSSFKSSDLKAGDWLSFINLAYENSEHDGIFIGWENGVDNKAVILSYGGENRPHPARYRTYDISKIYTVIRPK